MDSRERMLAAIEHKPVDRVPLDIWATDEVWKKLEGHFGSRDKVCPGLHIDGFGGAGPEYIGPPVSAQDHEDYWGMRYRPVDYGTGTYMEQSYNPLVEARTIDDLEKYRWPSADWFDYSRMRAAVEVQRQTKAVMVGYMAPFYFHNKLRGLEQSLADPLEDPAFTHRLLQRVSDFFFEQHRRMFEACEGLIDVTQVTDDYGSQSGPMIGLPTFREFYRPHLHRFIDLAKDFGIKVFHHDDGAMRVFLPDLVAMGIDILNPVQWTCPGMEMAALKRDFRASPLFPRRHREPAHPSFRHSGGSARGGAALH